MTDDFQSPPPVGDNSSAATPAELVADQVTSALSVLEARRAELIASAHKVAITDNDTIARASDLKAMVDVLIEKAWSTGADAAAPYTQAAAVAKNRTERWLTDLRTASAGIEARIGEFRNVQRRKIAAQQAEQRAEEAKLRGTPEMPEPAPRAEQIVLAPVRGDYGSQVGDRGKKQFTWTDARALPDDVLNHPKVKLAIEQACRDIIKIRDTIAGVTIDTVQTTSHRKPVK